MTTPLGDKRKGVNLTQLLVPIFLKIFGVNFALANTRYFFEAVLVG